MNYGRVPGRGTAFPAGMGPVGGAFEIRGGVFVAIRGTVVRGDAGRSIT
jgi:hypothetical protein